jgi:hypothetical protein
MASVLQGKPTPLQEDMQKVIYKMKEGTPEAMDMLAVRL